MTGDRDDVRGGDAPAEPAWHERTSTLVGASAAALVVMALLYFITSTLVREFNDPAPTPQYFLDPGGSSSSFSRTGSSTSTTQTITSTSPPVTSDINNPGETTTSGTDTSTSPSESTSRILPRTRDDEPRTTRSRPRLNETRTLYPQP
ncbi:MULTISPECIES: hypothetical protein [unclassified Mycobacterium]|uniref:hypothetical protein n=1 Tax=unclassified Mycobacterium TaxID=2642494 RepID=UPI0029C81313|nr:MULTISPECIES: hypothetical protein [unclassified Mycobacterium]